MSPIRASNVRRVTGLIYIVIIALWAAVLIPMWLRRHDQVSEVRSTARFGSSMKALASNEKLHDERVDMTKRHIDASTRRAIVLASLAGLALLTLIMALAGAAPKFLPILFAVLTASFLVASAMTANARTSSANVRRPVPMRTAKQAAAANARTTARAKSKADEEFENWNAWDDEDGWEAVPSTLPTYVTAPRATAVPRPIDNARPGEWTGSAMVAAAQEMRISEREYAEMAEALGEKPYDVHEVADALTAEIPAVQVQRAVNG